MTEIKCIGVLAQPQRPQSHPIAQQIKETIEAHGIASWMYTTWDNAQVQEDVQAADMVVAIGGDGSMLRAARVCAPYDVSVLGINMGQLGFLTEIRNPDNWEPHLKNVLEGNFWIERRTMIRVDVLRNGENIASGHALNDIVISSGSMGRMTRLDTYIDDDWTTTYYADALVISTATGSTAYALALGGPILPPELTNILLVPAAPHLSLDRAIILAEGSTVEIRASGINTNSAVISGDGIRICEPQTNDVIRVQVSEYVSRFVRLRGRNYFYRSLLERFEPRVRRDRSK